MIKINLNSFLKNVYIYIFLDYNRAFVQYVMNIWTAGGACVALILAYHSHICLVFVDLTKYWS